MQLSFIAQLPTFIKTLLLILMTGFLLSVSVGLFLYINETASAAPVYYILLCFAVSGTLLGVYRLLSSNQIQTNVNMLSGIVIAFVIAIISMLYLVNSHQAAINLQELFLLALASAAIGMPFVSHLKHFESNSDN